MITLQFVASAGLEAYAIAAFERGWCSHVDVVLDDGTLLGSQQSVISGIPSGVQVRPDHYEAWTSVERVSLNDICLVTGEMKTKFLAFLHAQLGKPYDNKALVGLVLNRDWRDDGSWFCSELVAAALEACGWFPRPLSTVASHISPRDLLLTVSPWAMP